MAIAIVQDTGTTFYSDGESLTLTKSGSDNYFIASLVARIGATGRTVATFDYGSQAFTILEEEGATALITQQMYHVLGGILDTDIPETVQTLDIGWSGAMSEDGNGVGILLSGVDQTNPYVDQSATAGIQLQAFANTVPTDLTFSCSEGDAIIYVNMNNNTAPGAITNFTQIGTGTTGDTILTSGASYIRIASSDLTDVTIPTPIGSSAGYHYLQVIRAASVAPPSFNVSWAKNSTVLIQ